MTELERRALLGDKEAQKECTENGILLPCPCCGGQAKFKKGFPSKQIAHCRQAVIQCKKCGVRTVTHRQLPMERWQDVDKAAIEGWNTRHAPQIGRCGECSHFHRNLENDTYCSCTGGLSDPEEDDFCSYFEQKGEMK